MSYHHCLVILLFSESEDHISNSEEKIKTFSPTTIDKETLSAQSCKKYLGGYRNKLNGKIYHHAMVQTEPPPWKYNSALRFNRYVYILYINNF